MIKEVFAAADQAQQRAYRLLTATVLPRLIGWVSSRSAAGVDNLAPYSSFAIVSSVQPMVGFTSFGSKDTLHNIRETGEFTITVASEHLVQPLNETASNFAPDESEFDACAVPSEPGTFVSVRRPSTGVCFLECRLRDIVRYGDGDFIVGEVLGWVIDKDALDFDHVEGPHPRPDALNPVAKLGVDEWAGLGPVFRLDRPAYNRDSS